MKLHFFHTWSKIENNIQYCTICNKARKIDCNHKWRIEKESLVYDYSFGKLDDYPSYSKYTLQCENCSTITTRNTK